MFFHENEKCPVCDRFFTADDDIVICPRCGTPHHRSCYNELGHCANNDKHGSDFEYKPAETKEVEQEKTDTDSKESQTVEIDIPILGAKSNEYTADDGTEEIDGKDVKDVAAVVGTNAKRFVPKFIKNKKLSWNWGAFFFGGYYLFFRKMIKQGIIALATLVIVNLVVSGFFIEEYNQFNVVFNSCITEMTNTKSTLSAELYDQLMTAYRAVLPMVMIQYGARAIVNTIIALFADRIYRSKVLGIINKVDEQLSQGGSFEQNSLFQIESNLNQEQMRRLYLARAGGVSLMMPVMAYLGFDLLISFISQLL